MLCRIARLIRRFPGIWLNGEPGNERPGGARPEECGDDLGPPDDERTACDPEVAPPLGFCPEDDCWVHPPGDPCGAEKAAEIDEICERLAEKGRSWEFAAEALCEIESEILRLRKRAAEIVFGVSAGTLVRVPGIDFRGRRPYNAGHVYRVTRITPGSLFPDVSRPETRPIVYGEPVDPPPETDPPDEVILARLWEIEKPGW